MNTDFIKNKNIIETLLKVKPIVSKKIIIETLSRLGIKSKIDKIIFPSCYYIDIDEKSYIVHFKQLFVLTRSNGFNNITEQDIRRRNAIAFLLNSWKMIECDQDIIKNKNINIDIIKHDDKKEWKIYNKFNMKNIL